MLRALSVLAFAAMVAGLAGQYYSGALFGIHPINIAVAIAASDARRQIGRNVEAAVAIEA